MILCWIGACSRKIRIDKNTLVSVKNALCTCFIKFWRSSVWEPVFDRVTQP